MNNIKKALKELYSWASYADEGQTRDATSEDWALDLASTCGITHEEAKEAVKIYDEVYGPVCSLEALDRFKAYIDKQE